MRSRRLIPLLLIALGTTALPARISHAAPEPAPATRPPTRVAIANPWRIFAEMKETKVLGEGLETKRKMLAAQEMEKRKEIEAMIQNREENYNPKHPKYIEISEKIDAAKGDFQSWGLKTKAALEREQKLMVKTLYDKIEAAIAQVAQQQGIDLVVADGRQEITNLEGATPEELRRVLGSRGVLYSTKSLDISELVIAVLDQQYAAKGAAGGGAAPAAGGAGTPPRLPSPTRP